MFTGIIEEIGTVTDLQIAAEGTDTDAVITIHGPLATSDAELGDSIAVSGVCLTVTSLTSDGGFTADVMPETLRRSALEDLTEGSHVNLERAMRADHRLGGHIVQGHVDTVATLTERIPGPRWDDLTFTLAEGATTELVVDKGSITISGVSLTVTDVTDTTLAVSLIPATLSHTTLGALEIGERVNIEFDILAKHVQRLYAFHGGPLHAVGTDAPTQEDPR